MHGFACKTLNFPHPAAPALARPESLHAPALKAPQEAGRRGGESIARKHSSELFSNKNIHM
ncbi:hypothetical protein QDQ61_07470 [Citrobacter freundii]|uniref:hypothetical protein n=1 Tax=Citrobacter sp. Cf111 TaxID=2985064 RepID=UPI000A3A7907|nr:MULTISPECIES: hypothetical protein [Citrobacter]AYL59652.1 hypothetical protein CUC48_25480 [Citrobacter freundii]MBX8660405.1 hypothetical protein [Citrobacter freundii]MDE8812393.1 hypothetical protein [Citrobacter freundii]MDL4575875.1 hypothetical protein [Citrobacter freundii]MDM3171628.1 hypothetical protein [Citrobacter sp. Cf111]